MKNENIKKTIIIADDHPLFLAGVRAELENAGGFDIIAEAGNGLEAFELLNKMNPDIAVLDIQMPGLNGIEIAERLQPSMSKVKIILLTMHNDRKIFFKALDAGISGYVLKDDAVLDIVDAVNCVIAGKEFISSSLTAMLVEKIKKSSVDEKIDALINELTPAEKKIMLLVSELHTNEEISEILFVSKRTIENHKVSISKKLRLKGSRDLLKFSVRYNEYFRRG